MNATLRLFVRSSSGVCLVKFNMFLRQDELQSRLCRPAWAAQRLMGVIVAGPFGRPAQDSPPNLSRFAKLGTRRANRAPAQSPWAGLRRMRRGSGFESRRFRCKSCPQAAFRATISYDGAFATALSFLEPPRL